MHRVFVYGTLKRGLRNHHFLETAKFIGEAHTLKPYCMLDGKFPVLRDAGHDRAPVSGEIYEIDDPILETLDKLEDVAGGMYERNEIDVVLRNGGQTGRALVYIGSGKYWDRQSRQSFLTVDQQGCLNWTPESSN